MGWMGAASNGGIRPGLGTYGGIQETGDSGGYSWQVTHLPAPQDASLMGSSVQTQASQDKNPPPPGLELLVPRPPWVSVAHLAYISFGLGFGHEECAQAM